MKFRDILKRLTRPISLEHLTDYEVYDDGDRFRTGKVILPVGQIDTGTGKLLPVTRLLVDDSGTPTDNTEAYWESPAGVLTRVNQVYLEAKVDATVTTRNIQFRISPHKNITMGTIDHIWNQTLTLSAGEEGQLMSSGNYILMKDDDGVVSIVANKNVFPLYFVPGGVIKTVASNWQAGDRVSLRVHYQVMGEL